MKTSIDTGRSRLNRYPTSPFNKLVAFDRWLLSSISGCGLCGAFRFFLFFVRGNVPIVALGTKNAQWMALALVAVAMPLLMMRLRHVHRTRAAA